MRGNHFFVSTGHFLLLTRQLSLFITVYLYLWIMNLSVNYKFLRAEGWCGGGLLLLLCSCTLFLLYSILLILPTSTICQGLASLYFSLYVNLFVYLTHKIFLQCTILTFLKWKGNIYKIVSFKLRTATHLQGRGALWLDIQVCLIYAHTHNVVILCASRSSFCTD